MNRRSARVSRKNIAEIAPLWPAILVDMPQVQDGWQGHELTPDAWLALVDVARTQQLAPLLYWQMRKWLPESPPGVQTTLHDLHMMASIGALLRERALRQALAALNAAGCKF